MADATERLQALKAKVAEADRQRATAEATVEMAKKRLAEIDAQIVALGVKPDDAEATLAKMEAQLGDELTAIEQALTTELAAYQQILMAAR